jgi:hypothetical protein
MEIKGQRKKGERNVLILRTVREEGKRNDNKLYK